MITLDINNGTVIYEYEPNAVYEKDGRTHTFVSMRKVTMFKSQKKFQNLTCKHEHMGDFVKWLGKIVDAYYVDQQQPREPGDEEF